MAPFLFRLVVSCLLFLVVVTAEENRTFKQKPGNITVLENTTALFDWRHTILNLKNVMDHNVTRTVNSIAISWFYLGKTKEQLYLLMSYTSTKGLYTAPSYQSDRLRYLEGSDSAAIELDKVSPRDDGYYQVRVVDPTDPVHGGFYICDTARLDVAKGLTFTVNVANQTYPDLSLPANVSSIRLPSLSVSVPDRVYVNISVSQTAPLPDIKMATKVGDVIQPELPCGKTYFCERNIPVTTRTMEADDVLFVLMIYFENVKNLAPINVSVPVEIFNQVEDTTEGPDKALAIILSLGITLAAAVSVSVVLLIVLHRKNKAFRERRPPPTSDNPTSLGYPFLSPAGNGWYTTQATPSERNL